MQVYWENKAIQTHLFKCLIVYSEATSIKLGKNVLFAILHLEYIIQDLIPPIMGEEWFTNEMLRPNKLMCLVWVYMMWGTNGRQLN